jgi:UDP-N-acetyl-D-mannosaminuronic acid dehydrogenase
VVEFELDVVIIGGCGHVGLPLGIVLADRGASVVVFDINQAAVDLVNGKVMPFDEPDAPEILERVIDSGQLRASTDRADISRAEAVIVVIGTPVDEHLNPDLFAVPDSIEALADQLVDGQILILRSTIYPGVTARVEQLLRHLGKEIDVAFCPERIAEGKAMVELAVLPQIVSARSENEFRRAEAVFSRIATEMVRLEPEEAELAKLFTNTYRYIKFAISNQFFMIANDYGLDFEKIRGALSQNYPRAADIPGPGFAAGPCLFKDTMQLAAFNNNSFTLGHSAMLVNEGLPLYLVSKTEERFSLEGKTVGILGMAFKSESDDIRSSLSYKLKRILRFRAHEVLCSDPYVTTDPDLVSAEEILERADIIFVGAPHKVYSTLAPAQPVVDVWNMFGKGVVVLSGNHA